MEFNRLNEFFNAAKNGDSKKLESIGTAAAAELSKAQKEKIERALSDPDLLSSLLSSPQAREIMKKIGRGDK